MSEYYSLDVWESVLKDVGFSFIDERVSWQTTEAIVSRGTGRSDCDSGIWQNCLIYRRAGVSTNINDATDYIKIWFDRKTEVISYISLENLNSSYNEKISLELFIDYYRDRFRHYLIEKITN